MSGPGHHTSQASCRSYPVHCPQSAPVAPPPALPSPPPAHSCSQASHQSCSEDRQSVVQRTSYITGQLQILDCTQPAVSPCSPTSCPALTTTSSFLQPSITSVM